MAGGRKDWDQHQPTQPLFCSHPNLPMRRHATLLALALALALGLLLPLAAADVGLLRASWSSGSVDRCIVYSPRWAQLAPSLAVAPASPAVLSAPPTGCSSGQLNVTNAAQFRGAAVMFERGCNFSTTVLAAAGSGAAAVVILNGADKDMIAPSAVNDSDYALANIPVVMADHQMAAALEQLVQDPASDLMLQVAQIQVHSFDYNCIVFFLMAWAALISGSLLQTAIARQKLRRALASAEGETLLPEEDDSTTGDNAADEKADVSLCFVLVFLTVATTMLLLLYFFFRYLVYVVIAFFVFAAGSALLRMFELVVFMVAPRLVNKHSMNLRLPFGYRTNFTFLFLAACSYGFSVSWAVLRHEDFSFVLQDILGVALIISALEVVRVNNMKIGTVLLTAFLVYDIFFVFVTPYLTPNHDSVMVTAATGSGGGDSGGAAPEESLPLALRVPRFNPVPCYVSESMLGFGDIVIPGIHVAFALGFDVNLAHYALLVGQAVPVGVWNRYRYFITALVAYTLGLTLTYIGMVSMNTPQPALMYLSPSLLLGLWGMAWWRGQVGLMWKGWPEPGSGGKGTASKSNDDIEKGLLNGETGEGSSGGGGGGSRRNSTSSSAGSELGGLNGASSAINSPTRRRTSGSQSFDYGGGE